MLKFTGPVISFEETLTKPLEKQGDPLQIGPTDYIDTQKPGVFVNHSCAPNAGIKNNKVLVAINDINKGEEIQFDYSTSMHENCWTLECKCGSTKCRGIVRDFVYLPPVLQKRYLGLNVVQNFIRTEFTPRNSSSNILY